VRVRRASETSPLSREIWRTWSRRSRLFGQRVSTTSAFSLARSRHCAAPAPRASCSVHHRCTRAVIPQRPDLLRRFASRDIRLHDSRALTLESSSRSRALRVWRAPQLTPTSRARCRAQDKLRISWLPSAKPWPSATARGGGAKLISRTSPRLRPRGLVMHAFGHMPLRPHRSCAPTCGPRIVCVTREPQRSTRKDLTMKRRLSLGGTRRAPERRCPRRGSLRNTLVLESLSGAVSTG
jgi:hypothetical protein